MSTANRDEIKVFFFPFCGKNSLVCFFYLLKINFFYNVVLVSAIQQCKERQVLCVKSVSPTDLWLPRGGGGQGGKD